jgi:hypothetical protein
VEEKLKNMVRSQAVLQGKTFKQAEVDAQGRRRRVEVFATDRLGAAAIRSHRH